MFASDHHLKETALRLGEISSTNMNYGEVDLLDMRKEACRYGSARSTEEGK